MDALKELGVGLIYFQGFENFLASHLSLIDVVEIEPQTFWYDKNDECDAFKYNSQVMDLLQTYNRPKLFHSVGYPVGGTVLPSQQHFNTLRRQAADLRPEWISEHLSFNFFKEGDKYINSGFLLPPLQSKEGVKTAVANIQNYRAEMNLPFAFETGVNYLKPRRGEMPDGLFVHDVAEQADCHILLDLHNILVNQRNGRQSVKEFLEYLPYERVIELHIGGGIYYKDYYLDAHSGPADKELLSILENIVGKLPNLKALMFEITPDYFMKVPEADIRDQLIKMREIWDKRGKYLKKPAGKSIIAAKHAIDESISVNEWEYTLGKLVLGKNPQGPLSKELQEDKGIEIISDLVFHFRASLLVSMLKFTTRLLRLSVGEDIFNQYIFDFFDNYSPELMPVMLADQFCAIITEKELQIPYLEKILEYELASVHTTIDKKTRTVCFDFDPLEVFTAIENVQLPDIQVQGEIIMLDITYNHVLAENELPEFMPVFHT